MSYHEHAMKRLTVVLALAASTCCFADYRAKVVLENGANLPAPLLFTPPPAGHDLAPCRILDTFADGEVRYVVPFIPQYRGLEPGPQDKCQITIWLKGYQKQNVVLHDGAVIVLKQVGDTEGSNVSAASLDVPKSAAKAFDKGIEAVADGKLPDAQKQFEKAVDLYPDYAKAWSHLGEVLALESKPADAAAAWQHALKADPKYIRPYLQLMRLDVSENKMDDAVALADRAMRLNPVEFPGIYYYDAVANYQLKRLDAAEKIAREAIDLDKSHDFPHTEVILAGVLADKGDWRGAVEHFSRYVALYPKAPDVSAIQQRIAELQHRLDQAN
jgi:tetratricopeptide (TPR) repeat protein